MNISTNATNVDAGMKAVALTILGPDGWYPGLPVGR